MIEQLGSETKAARQKLGVQVHEGPTHYELLDVSTQATRLQIREAYIRLKNTYASGSQALYSLMSDDEARQTLEKMEEAYRILDDEMLRKEYDELIGLQRESAKSLDIFAPTTETRVNGRSELNPFQNDAEATRPWTEEPPERKPSPRMAVSTLSKIKKFAARAFTTEVKAQEETLLANPQTFDGVVLTQLRELMGVPQSEVQERTKIAIEYIKALENNDFQKLPSLVYVRGFLKIYLQYLGLQDLEGRLLIDAYAEKYNHWREKHRPHS